jgi:hypothetical protein
VPPKRDGARIIPNAPPCFSAQPSAADPGVARITRHGDAALPGRLAIFLVGDMRAPHGRFAGFVEDLNGDVRHEAIRSRSVPVLLARLEKDAVAGMNRFDWAAPSPAASDALGHENRLPDGMRVPGGAGAGREVNVAGDEPRRTGGRGDGIDTAPVNHSLEPIVVATALLVICMVFSLME